MEKNVQKIITWSKDHPLMAGGLVVGAVGLGYLASKSMDKLTLVSDSVVDDAAGAGIMEGGGEDERAPLVPYVDFDPVSGIPVLPSSDDGGDDPPVYTWVPEILEDVLPGGGGFWGEFDVSVFDNVSVEDGRPAVRSQRSRFAVALLVRPSTNLTVL